MPFSFLTTQDKNTLYQQGLTGAFSVSPFDVLMGSIPGFLTIVKFPGSVTPGLPGLPDQIVRYTK